uniref:Uncharacterized protein n=1 Tax=Tanacetum cinerariifolium TaxID=118510 RepID=A0A699KPR7_TANCI|nr:hypothetical protein [Tanacetum cinerariifolium]
MVKEIRVRIHGYDVETDFVVVDYVNEGEPSIVFGRSFLVTTKSQIDFRLGEMRIDVTMLKEDKDVDTLLENLMEDMIEVAGTSGELVKMDMGHGTMTINNGVINHTYYSQPRTKAYLDNFEIDEDEDWLNCFKVGRDEDGSSKYGSVSPLF